MNGKKATSKIPGCILQRDKDYRVIRLKIIAGNIDGEQMNILSDIAKRYGRGYIGITSRMGIEIPWISPASMETAVEELKNAGFTVGSTGPTVRTIVSCKGSICVHGLGDTQELCRRLDKAYFGIPLPAKFKIGIAGCPNNCVKAQLNDLGFMGQCIPKFDGEKCIKCRACVPVCKGKAIEDDGESIRIDRSQCIHCGSCLPACPVGALTAEEQGFAAFLGGKFGRQYRIGRRWDGLFTMDQAVELTGKILTYYKDNANPGERFGDMLGRLGK